jgi:hypothetical protein
VLRAQLGCQLEPAVDGIDGDDAATVEPRKLADDQTRCPLTEDRDRFPHMDVSVEYGVERDRTDMGEGADDRVDIGGQRTRRRSFLRQYCGAAMTPGPPDDVAGADRSHIVAELDDLTHLLVAPPLHRILEARRIRDEQPAVLLPSLGEVGIRAAIRGEFGAGRDAGEEGADSDLVRRERSVRVVLKVDDAGSGETHDVGHGHSVKVGSEPVGVARSGHRPR